MTTPREQDLMSIAGWPAGQNNITPETDLPAGIARRGETPPGALRLALNVDMDDTGRPRRRRGATLALPLEHPHSLWPPMAVPGCPFALCVAGGHLQRIEFQGGQLTATPLAPVHSDAPMSFEAFNGRVYYTNGADTGIVLFSGERRPWGVAVPAGPPALEAVAGQGGMDAGRYQVTITYADRHGEQSGAPLGEVVDVPQGGGIRLSRIPLPDDLSIAAIQVWRTRANGKKVYYCRDLPPTLDQYFIAKGRLGRALETQFMTPPPPGQIVRRFHARLYVASGRTLFYTDALHAGCVAVDQTYFRLPGAITLLEAGLDGLYVGTERAVWFYAGSDPATFQPRQVFHPGAIAGSGLCVPGSAFGPAGYQGRTPVWLSTEGVLCRGMPEGIVQPLTEGRLALPPHRRAALALRQFDGIQQVLALLREPAGVGAHPRSAVDAPASRVFQNGLKN